MFMGFRRNVLYISERNINRLRMQQSWFSIFVKARTKLYAMFTKYDLTVPKNRMHNT